jgi:hypothetical protein
MGEVQRLPAPRMSFSLQAADPQWVQDLALLVESVETVRPPGALPDWQPGATVRLPYSRKVCSDGAVVCTQALMALADTAMVLACSAAWNGYHRPDHAFLAPGEFRCRRRCAGGPYRPQYELRPRHAAQCRRPAADRHGGERLCDALKERMVRSE